MITLTLIGTIIAITIGSSFQFGYQTGVVNDILGVMENFTYNVSISRGNEMFTEDEAKFIISLIVAMFPVGGLIGALCGGYIANKFGRKKALLLTSIPTLIGSGLMLFSKLAMSYEMVIVGRFIIGISSGIYTGLAPVYLSEIAPLKIRGATGSLHQLVIVLAVVVAEVLGLPQILGSDNTWPYLLGISIIPAIIQIITIGFCPDSPSYLMLTKQDEVAAKDALQRLRGGHDIQQDINELMREAQLSSAAEPLSLKELFLRPHLRLGLLIGIGMHLSQQMSGNNAIINYSSDVFKKAGLKEASAIYATIGVGMVSLLITTIFIFVMDRFNRRSLLLFGFTGCCLCTISLTVSLSFTQSHSWLSFVGVSSVILFVAFFSTGAGSIPWFFVAEVFTQESRDSAQTVVIFINWTVQIAIGIGYPQLLKYLSNYNFVPFSVSLALSVFFVIFVVPETRNRTPEDLEWELKRRVTPGGARLMNSGVNLLSAEYQPIPGINSFNDRSSDTASDWPRV